MNICFLARPIYDRVSTSLYNCMTAHFDKEIGGVFITTTSYETSYVKKTVPEAVVYQTSQYIREHWEEFDPSQLEEYEKKYDCAPIWSYIYTDRFLINQNYEYATKMTAALFSFFEYVYSNNNIDYYYSETIATLLCYIGYMVGKKFGVKYICQMGARGLDSTHHYFLCDPYQYNMNMESNWKEIHYSDEERERANDFLTQFETKDIRPTYMIKNGAVPKLRARYIALPILRVINKYSAKFNDPYSYIYYQQHKDITNPIKFYFRYQQAKKYYNKADYTKKYVYFPLHFQPEASTIVCAEKYEKQLYFIDSWAKSLPADTVLYVKEHYAILGHRDLQFYKELRKYPNVVLIDPYEDPRKMILNAYAVTTLTGTAGWEAMLLRKPVFIGGNIFFDSAPGVIKVTDIYHNYLNHIDKWVKPAREDIITYLCAYFRSLNEGSIGRIYSNNEDSENIFKVASSLYNQLISIQHS